MRTRSARARVRHLIVFSMAFGLLAASCFGGMNKVWRGSQLSGVFRRVPASAYNLQNPYRGQPKQIIAGRKLFRQHCSHCHGNNAEGTGEAPALRTSGIRNTPDGVLFWFLRNGKLRAGMPSWSGLPPQQRWQLVSFLKSLQ